MSEKWIRPLAAAIAVLAASTVAQAGSPTAADRATARQLMLEARNLRYDGDLRGALEKFRAADALMGVPTTGLEVAKTQAELGLLVEALDTCVGVIHHPEERGEPRPFQQAREQAKTLRERLQARIPTLRFVFPAESDSSDVELRVDGVVIPQAARQVPRLVNPGDHEILLVEGTFRQRFVVRVEEGETRDVALVLPQRAQSAADTQAVSPGPNPWVWGGFATAAVGGAVGGVAGLLAWSDRNHLDDACPNRTCPPDEMDRVDRAKTYATVSTYALVVGGIGAAVGVGALLSTRKDPSEADVGVSVSPCSGTSLCVNGTF